MKISPFDASASSAGWLVRSPQGRNWRVPEPCARFLRLVDGTRSRDDLQRELDVGDYDDLSGCDVDDVLDKLVFRLGLDAGAPAAAARRRRPLWSLTFLLPLVDAERVRPLSRLVRPLLGRRTVIAALVFGFLIQIASWRAAVVAAGAAAVAPAPLTLVPIPSGSQTAPARSPASLALTAHVDATDALPPAIRNEAIDRVTSLALLALLLLVVMPVHELGHIAAAHRFGSGAGKIGIGFYLFMPLMYVDLSPTWALGRRQRAAVDVAGLYFQFLSSCVLAAAYLAWRRPVLEVAAMAYLTLGLLNLNPVFKFDGYWCVSDLLGVPNLQETAWRSLGRLLPARFAARIAAGMPTTARQRALLAGYAVAQGAFFALMMYALVLPVIHPGAMLPVVHSTPAKDLSVCAMTVSGAAAHGLHVTPVLFLRVMLAIYAGMFVLRMASAGFRGMRLLVPALATR